MSGGAGTQYFSLRWNNHPGNLVSVFTGLYQAESLVDVSLAAEGKHLQAHKVVLSACSDYFQSLFATNKCQHPIVILKDVAFDDLETVVKFMYHGIVNVSSDKLPAVLKTADALQIKGLEKSNELMAPYLSNSSPRSSSSLLSVPGQTRQPSTESLPEYLQRSRSDAGYYPHRAHSAESRGMSFESHLEVSRPKRVLSPPGSPSHVLTTGGSYARKKFRNRSENNSSLGTSVDQSTEEQPPESPPKVEVSRGVSPSCYNSPSTSYPSQDEHIAKKKRAMFQARKAGSSSGSKSSEMHTSSDGRPEKDTKLQSQSSSSQSISHSSDREDAAASSENTLQVPSIAQSRTMVRAASASEISQHHSALTTKFKRGRFLKRQQCQEATEETEGTPITRSEPPPSPPSTQQLVKQHSQPLLPSQQSYSPPRSSPPPKEEPRDPMDQPSHAPPPARQPSLDPLCGLESVPLLYSSSGPRLPQSNLFRPTLPSVRIIPEPEPQPQHELVPHHSPVPGPQLTPNNSHSPGLLYPGVGVAAYEQVSPPPHHLDKKSPGPMKPRPNDGSNLSVMTNNNPPGNYGHVHPGLGPHPVHGPHMPPHGHGPTTLSPVRQPTQYNSHNSQTTMEQFGHCPKARDGPALSCNFCWNTTDGSGRILRRKTKYHCPECQTNLCIVPCFQQYHEAMENENAVIH